MLAGRGSRGRSLKKRRKLRCGEGGEENQEGWRYSKGEGGTARRANADSVVILAAGYQFTSNRIPSKPFRSRPPGLIGSVITAAEGWRCWARSKVDKMLRDGM